MSKNELAKGTVLRYTGETNLSLENGELVRFIEYMTENTKNDSVCVMTTNGKTWGLRLDQFEIVENGKETYLEYVWNSI